MSTIPPGFGTPPIASSLSGLSSAGKSSSSDRTAQGDSSASKVVETANTETKGLTESEKSSDRDADGRQFYDSPQEISQSPDRRDQQKHPAAAPRAKDPLGQRGNQIDLDV